MPEEKRNYTITEEERKKRSERAKKQRAEGKLGGSDIGQGRKKKPRASKHIAEKARQDSEKYYAKLKRIVETGSPSVALGAIKLILEIEGKEETLSLKEKELAYSQETREQLKHLIAEKIKELKAAGINLPAFVDGKATEIKEEAKELESGTKAETD
jgi:hypothetical protein